MAKIQAYVSDEVAEKLMPLWRNGKLRAPGRKMLVFQCVYDACRVRLESL